MKLGILAKPHLTPHQLNSLLPVLNDARFSIAFFVIHTRPPLSLKQKIRKNIKRGRGGYMLVMAVQRYLKRKQEKHHTLTKAFCGEQHIPYLETERLYNTETCQFISRHMPDVLVLSGGFGIIREPLLTIAPHGMLSYHNGNMRKYRGMPPGLWELYHGENQMGITVQKLSAGLDCGIPIEEKNIPVYLSDTLTSLQQRANREGEDMLYRALQKIATPGYQPQSIDNFGKVRTLPTLMQWLLLTCKITFRRGVRSIIRAFIQLSL